MENLQTVETLTRHRTSQTIKRLHRLTKITVLLCISTIAAIVVVLATPAPSVAITITQSFDIFFDDGAGPFVAADWSGTFTVQDGIVTTFTAINVGCSEIAKCTYTGAGFPFPGTMTPDISTIPFPSGATFGQADLHLINGLKSEGEYGVHTPLLPGFGSDSFGFYITAPIPEPPVRLLLLAGLVAIVLLRQTSPHRNRTKMM